MLSWTASKGGSSVLYLIFDTRLFLFIFYFLVSSIMLANETDQDRKLVMRSVYFADNTSNVGGEEQWTL